MAVPDMAASTCSQRLCRRHTSPIAPTGSIAFEEVVPTVAHTKNGVSPACRSASTCRAKASGRMARFSSTSISRRFSTPMPAIIAAFSREEWAVWKTIDYAASNLYDYQSHFYDPDGFDAALSQLRDATSGKPFLAVELCVNNGSFQSPAYRLAFAMGQLYRSEER